MAANILTPAVLWADFQLNIVPNATVVKEKKRGDVILSYLKIEGAEIKGEKVSIAGVMAKTVQETIAPAVLIVQDFNDGLKEDLIISFAKKGYTALVIDLAGKVDGKDFYTEYPESISYANYEKVKDNLYSFKGDARNSSFYQWTCAVRYAVKYLASISTVTNIGGIGIGKAATAMWQAVSFDDNFSASIFIRNAGWAVYRGTHKFSNQAVPQFSDDVMKILAGVEPQAYAPHVKCPSLTIVCANDNEFDVDRADDTVLRVGEKVYSAVNYSTCCNGQISSADISNAVKFLDIFVANKNQVKDTLPAEVEIKCEIIDGNFKVEVIAPHENLKDVELYVAEGEINPALRSWVIVPDKRGGKNGVYKFNYQPYKESNFATFFAKAKYKNGLEISSEILAKNFEDNIVGTSYKSAIMYSSRTKNSESIFISVPQDSKITGVDVSGKNIVSVKAGPMGIDGAHCVNGLLSFAIGSPRYKPNDGSLLMFDVTGKKDLTLKVKLITDYFGNKTEFFAPVYVRGGKVWHNVKLELANFKAENGMGLKTYAKVQAIEFIADDEFILNNVLWI
ncbi:MAG: hypothetical protein IJZ73_03480 [Clostridia bacterium]|nr:hypothetical protein [Clostridia bacterium]